jgi:hypothetical protein
MPVTFPVDSVQPLEPLIINTNPIGAIQEICGIKVEAFGADCQSLIDPIVQKVPGRAPDAKMNGFLKAIHESYANHYPLILSPDDVWLAIAQGFSYHVNANVEKLRNNFVKHDGKATIKIRRDQFIKGSPNNDWPGCFSEFSKCIANYIGQDKRDLLVSDFSTSTSLHRAVSEITLMNTLKAYFDYVVETKCGIPAITLTGNERDWERIIEKATALIPFQCEVWITNLLKILNNFLKAFKGNADPSLWTNIYKIKGPQGSGGTTISGWVNVFFPYLNDWRSPGEFSTPNPSSIAQEFNYGPAPDRFPLGITLTPFIWDYFGVNIPMNFLAGFIGTTQELDSLAIRPVQGWGIAQN